MVEGDGVELSVDVVGGAGSGQKNIDKEIKSNLEKLRNSALYYSVGHAPNDVNAKTIHHGLYRQSPFAGDEIDIAASGFSLAALPAAVENKLISKNDAQEIALSAAIRIKELTQKSAGASTVQEILYYGYKGMLSHYYTCNE